MVALLAMNAPAEPGLMFLAGGGRTAPELVRRFVAECDEGRGLIVVLPLAAAEPDGRSSEALLKEHGAQRTVIFAKAQPTPKDLEELRQTLQDARGIWMAGGVQGRIVERLTLPWIEANLRPLYGRGLHVYGTSAGAMVLAETMILGPGKEPNTSEVGPGMGLTSWVIDTHFRERNREPRLRHALRITGKTRGLGIDERDWVVMRGDRILEVHGSPTLIETAKAAAPRPQVH
jgi:cyanophycinase